MTGFFIIVGGVFLFATVITLMDWLGRRQRRRREAQDRAADAAASPQAHPSRQ